MLVWCSRAAARASSRNRSRCDEPARLAGRQDLQRHVPAQRLLHGLVDDAHAAPADLAEDAVVAQLPRGRRPRSGPRRRRVRVAVPRDDLFSSSSTRAGKSSRISSASSGYLRGVLLDARPLAARGTGRGTSRPAARSGRGQAESDVASWSSLSSFRLRQGRGRRQDSLRRIEGPGVALAGGRLVEPEHLRRSRRWRAARSAAGPGSRGRPGPGC